MIGIAVLLVMVLFPGLIWAGFRYWLPDGKAFRLASATILPPVLLIAAVLLDFALNRTPQDKLAAPSTYALVFCFELLMSIGIAGGCEAWFGVRPK